MRQAEPADGSAGGPADGLPARANQSAGAGTAPATTGSGRVALTEAIPEWNDSEKMSSGMADVIEYARAQGFPDEELSEVVHSSRSHPPNVLYDR